MDGSSSCDSALQLPIASVDIAVSGC